MLAGIIDHSTHTRDIRKLGNLKLTMPRTATFFLLAAGSLAALPPFLGFISKESAIESSLHIAQRFHGIYYLLPILLGVGALITVGVAGKISLGVFFAKPQDPDHLRSHYPHKAPWMFIFPPALLACLGLVLGLAPGLLSHLIYPVAMVGIYGIEPPHFALWHGFNPALMISLSAFAGGFLVYRFRHSIQVVHEKLKLGWNLNTLYDAKWDRILSTAKQMTDTIQNGSLTRYVTVLLGFFSLLIIYTVWSQNIVAFIPAPTNFEFGAEVLIALLVCIACLLVVLLKDRIARIVALGAVGILICSFFTFRGAPDLALTGFLVEIVMFIVVLIVFNRLDFENVAEAKPAQKVGAFLLAGCTGIIMGGITYLALSVPLAPSIHGYFLKYADKLAGGLNVVNVILVDFRGFDTFGEITVLCLAGLGVYALRNVWVIKKETHPLPAELTMPSLPPSQLLRPISAVIVPLIILFSWYMVFRGHNHPGGGFIGGLITGGGLILELLAVGRSRFLKELPIHGRALFTGGLAIAFLTGIVPLFMGYPFLTSTVFESIHFSTSGIFDIGVYFVVVGVTLDIIVLMEESERETIKQ